MSKSTTEKPYKGTKRDQLTIILEDMRSDFRVFGEGLQSLDQKVEKLDLKVELLDRKMDIVSSDVGIMKGLLQNHDDNLRDHEDRITALENNS